MKYSDELRLRSITYTVNINKIDNKDYQLIVEKNINKIRSYLTSKGVFVRTTRINIIKLRYEDLVEAHYFINKVKALSNFCNSIGIRWFNISFDLLDLNKKQIKTIRAICLKVLTNYENAFINLIVSDNSNVNPYAALSASELIIDVSKINDNGFDNFRLGVSLNPNNGTPFFPFSYSDKEHSFSFAVEMTEIILNNLNNNIIHKKLDDLKLFLIDAIAPEVKRIDNIGLNISKKNKLKFWGQDLSLAPYPDEKVSVIKVLKLIGLDDIGSSGTLFFTAYLTDFIKKLILKTKIRHTGFNGVMYSLLEDHLMAEANNKKLISVDKIISYSTLCGCGLDMVPVPGNLIIEELASIILDVSSIAISLNKPLGVRVLPIQNKFMNEFTEYDMDFLTNTRIMKLKNLSINSAFLSNSINYEIK